MYQTHILTIHKAIGTSISIMSIPDSLSLPPSLYENKVFFTAMLFQYIMYIKKQKIIDIPNMLVRILW